MDESEFAVVRDLFGQSADSRVQRWDAQTLADALVWCAQLQRRPHALGAAQRQLCHGLGIDLADPKRALLTRLMQNPFCSGPLMAAVIRSFPDPVAFADAFAPVARLEARAELALGGYGYHDGEAHRARALGGSILDQLRHADDAGRRRDLVQQLSAQEDTVGALFWAFAEAVDQPAPAAAPNLADEIRAALIAARIDLDRFQPLLARSSLLSESFGSGCVPILVARIAARMRSSGMERPEAQDEIRFVRLFIMEHSARYRERLRAQIEECLELLDPPGAGHAIVLELFK